VSARPELGETTSNVKRVVDAIASERAAGSRLVVFPEMFLTGYMLRDEVRRLALDPQGPELGALADACRSAESHLVVGFPKRTAKRGVVTNSSALVGPRGIVGIYDKIHLPTFSVFEEGLYYEPGRALPVFDTPLGRVGMCICYDLFFPEVTKAMAMAGADVIVVPSASPTISQRYFEAIFAARAIETTSYLLYANAAGPQDTLIFWGGPQAWSPRGERLGLGTYVEESTLRVAVDLATVEEMRAKRPTLRDTRPDILSILANGAPRDAREAAGQNGNGLRPARSAAHRSGARRGERTGDGRRNPVDRGRPVAPKRQKPTRMRE
jgi:predicted amidohydrolase